jgi:hypothetical protein
MPITIDKGHNIPVYSPICTFCKHLKEQGRTCKAFPEKDSIPMEIWTGENDHKKPYSGDHGIRFEKRIP